MKLIYHWLFQVSWMSFAACWLITAMRVKKIKQREPALDFVTHHGLSIVAFLMAFTDWFRVGPLGWALWPQTESTFFAGAAIMLAGLGLAVWARLHLGRNWSSSVALKEGHQLIRSGPYALVRHPIYTGIITGLAGTAAAIGEMRGVVAVVLLTATYTFKYRREEGLMRKAFSDEYVSYSFETGGLLPKPSTWREHPLPALAATALLLALLFSVVSGWVATPEQRAADLKAVHTGWLQPLGAQWDWSSAEKTWSIQIVPDPLTHAGDVLRFELRKGDVRLNHDGEPSFRAGVETDEHPPMKSTRWYRFSLFLPKEYPVRNSNLILARWHAEDKESQGGSGPSAVLAFRCHNGQFYVTLRHSAERLIKNADAVPLEVLFRTPPASLNEWTDFVVEAKWSYEMDGLVNIWWNGKPIVQYHGPAGYNDDAAPYFQFGLYGDTADKNPGTSVVYVKGVKLGATPEDVDFYP
jgi:protein-S-isoprenylcysteine O-methyltransferase Ste14